MRRGPKSPLTLVVGCLAALVVLVGGCGTRRDYDELLEAARGSSTLADAAASSSGGDESVAGGLTPSGAVGGSPSAGPVGGATATAPTGASGATGSGGAAETAAAAQSCTGDEAPLRIGSVGAFSGLLGAILIDLTLGAQAWVAAINARGGLDCHPVELIVADDAGDPARNIAVVRQLVEQRHVIAFVTIAGVVSGQGSVDYLTERGIPVLGSEGVTPGFYTSPVYFPNHPHFDQYFESFMAVTERVAVQLGYSRFGLISCLEISFCATVDRLAPTVVPAHGMTLSTVTRTTLVQPDYTAVCQSHRDARTEVLYVLLDSGGQQRLAASCSSIGYEPRYAISSLLMTNATLENPRYDGTIISTSMLPPITEGNAEIDAFLAAMATYLPGREASFGALEAWVSGRMLEKAGATLSDPPTNQDILNGLWQFRGEDIGGVTTPMTFTEGEPATPLPWCAFAMLIDDARYTIANNGERLCSG